MAACISPARWANSLTSNLESLPALGKTLLWKGAQKIRFEM
jgi:hypothetical protein